MPNLVFGTPNTKNSPSWDVLNVSKFWDMLRMLSNMRAYGQKCYNSFDYFIYFSLSSQHISLFVCNIALSLSFMVSIFPLLPISFSLSFFLSLTLFLSLCISVFCVTISLSFFSCHEKEGDSDLKQSSLMVGWVWSLIDLLGWGFVEDFEFLFFIFIFKILLRFLDLEFVGGFGDCGCSLWRWL